MPWVKICYPEEVVDPSLGLRSYPQGHWAGIAGGTLAGSRPSQANGKDQHGDGD